MKFSLKILYSPKTVKGTLTFNFLSASSILESIIVSGIIFSGKPIFIPLVTAIVASFLFPYSSKTHKGT